VRRFPLRRLAGAELSATVKRCSRAYSPGRPLLHAVQPIQRNNTGAASAVVRPKRRRTPRRKNCEYAPEHCRTACPLDSRSPIGSMLRESNASRSEELGAWQASLFSTLIGSVAATRTDFQLSRRWFKIPAPSFPSATRAGRSSASFPTMENYCTGGHRSSLPIECISLPLSEPEG
jgi:hypothetical protein